MDARANAARALGILRGRKAVPDLVEALHSKNTDVIYESLVALQKIRDESAGPRVTLPAARPRPEGANRGHRNHRPAAQQRRRAGPGRRAQPRRATPR